MAWLPIADYQSSTTEFPLIGIKLNPYADYLRFATCRAAMARSGEKLIHFYELVPGMKTMNDLNRRFGGAEMIREQFNERPVRLAVLRRLAHGHAKFALGQLSNRRRF